MSWQAEVGFSEVVDKLDAINIRSQIKGDLIGAEQQLSDREIRGLVGFASLLSLSDEKESLSEAYEIVSKLIENVSDPDGVMAAAAGVVLARIGNFPGRSLLRERYGEIGGVSLSPSIALECIAREAENTVSHGDAEVPLTDFQYELFSALSEEPALSVSAPTSAGKSFVLTLDLIRRIRNGEGQSIVYVVPTRALVTEVSGRIRDAIRAAGLEGAAVRTAPFPISKENVKCAVIYVLTQERLMSLLTSREGGAYVTSLIVDEAHEIQKGKRGVILQNAIDLALSRNPDANVFFASPLISNPSYFLSLFGVKSRGKYFTEVLSPVSQNVILVSEVKGRPKRISVSRLKGRDSKHVGDFDIGFEFRGAKAIQIASFAASVCKDDESAIVFANGPADAEDYAREVGKIIGKSEISEGISAFIDFIRREIHPEYPLIECLEQGAAFHYGRMPSLVRSGVERLFKSGEVRILCCTSTLLQGVNLPAKHIIIENPKSGDEPMSRADFLNLSGRAGRLLKEFHGNVWCLRPSTWKEKSYVGDGLQEVCSTIDILMKDGGGAIRDLLAGRDVGSETEVAEAVFGKLYFDYVRDPALLDVYRTDSNAEALGQTIEEMAKVKITVSHELLERHKALRPDHIQALYLKVSQELFLDGIIPVSPYIAGAKLILDRILVIISESFSWKMSDRFRGFVSWLAYNWMRGVPIDRLISDRINSVRVNDPEKSTSSIIRGLLDVLEDSVRFKLVKYFSAYLDVLELVMGEEGGGDGVRSVDSYHIYLEFGSANRHALSLMALGLSRFTALHLQDRFDFVEPVEVEVYLERLREIKIESLNMPQLCKQELKELIRG